MEDEDIASNPVGMGRKSRKCRKCQHIVYWRDVLQIPAGSVVPGTVKTGNFAAFF